VPDVIRADRRPDHAGTLFWWASNQDEVSTYWYAYQSRWIPVDRFAGAGAKAFAQVLFDASRHSSIELHFNKGQAGASADAIRRGRATSINPAVYDAAALAIVSAHGTGYPGVAGHEPDRAEAEAARANVSAAMTLIRDATPGSGTYVNEADYFEADWQRTFWGDNYSRLLAIKQQVDPTGLFSCHHCVGSAK
jgi:FAD/FMN-containing dehydrogenase